MTTSNVSKRLDKLEEQLKQQQKRIKEQQETIADQRDQISAMAEGSSAGSGFSRRTALKTGGILGLLGLGVGSAAADPTPTGRVGTENRPLEELNTHEIHAPESNLEVTTGDTDRVMELGIPQDDNLGFQAGGNIVLGHKENTISDSAGSVIGGGGSEEGSTKATNYDKNEIDSSDYSFIGGGNLNKIEDSFATIAGGHLNTVRASRGSICGGRGNELYSSVATISGGLFNQAGHPEETGSRQTIGGGDQNEAFGNVSTVAGGSHNQATGEYSIIPGGRNNVADGDYSFAAGREAHADHDGSFVFGDSESDAIHSQSEDEARFQMPIVATGGIDADENTISTLAEPTNDDDAATKGYVDQEAQALSPDRYLQEDAGDINFSGPAEWVNDGDIDTNQVIGDNAAVLAGANNVADGIHTVVSGGTSNEAMDSQCSVGGGSSNEASSSNATVGGGLGNGATGSASTVAGGKSNLADGFHATVCGGGSQDTGTGDGNQASGQYSFIGGGEENTATGDHSVICGGGGDGGQNNVASEPHSTIAGGQDNSTSGSFSTISGGAGNQASGFLATIPGGEENIASGDWSFAAGHLADTNNFDGAFVWGDSTEEEVQAEAEDEFVVQAGGGTVIFSDSDTSTNTGVHLEPGAGSWASLSSEVAKTNISSVDPKTVLEKVESLDLATWEYKTQEDVPHMGPMAEDFYEAFGLGGSSRRITNVDIDGVALAAIQGLSEQLKEKSRRIEELESALKQRLEQLEAKVEN